MFTSGQVRPASIMKISSKNIRATLDIRMNQDVYYQNLMSKSKRDSDVVI